METSVKYLGTKWIYQFGETFIGKNTFQILGARKIKYKVDSKIHKFAENYAKVMKLSEDKAGEVKRLEYII